jgi:UDP-N-acetylmuramoyl-tripeptide--D-alanyl-D-alanine ligase
MTTEAPLRKNTSAVMTISEVLSATGGSLIRGGSEKIFHGVSIDSRKMHEGALFICLKGENFDGHHFLAAAGAAGAAGFVIQNDPGRDLSGVPEKGSVILVEDTLKALGGIARFWRKKLDVPVIAITGSSGKTTTKEMVAGILDTKNNVLKTEGNLNNRIGLPLTLLGLTGQHDVAVVEMGTNMPGEIACLTRIAAPDIGLITNIGAAHLEKLKSLANIREEKGALFQNMVQTGIAVINVDDKALDLLGRRWQGKQITFGWKHGADVSAHDIRKTSALGIAFRLRSGQETRQIQMQVNGEHNLYNALGAAAAAMAFGADLDSICQGLESIRAVSGRFEIKALQNGAHVINDTYNANPLSVREALKTLKALRGSGDSAVILGDMMELGNKAGQWHRKMGRAIAETGVKSLFLMGDYGCDTAAGAREKGMAAARILFCETPEQVQDHLQSLLKPGDWVLVKGSRKMKMERIVQMMTESFGLQERAAV